MLLRVVKPVLAAVPLENDVQRLCLLFGPTLLIPPFLLVQKFINTTMHEAGTWLQPTFRRLLWRTHTRVTYRDRSHVRPRVRIFDTASQGITPASSVHPGGLLLLATTNAQAPSADSLSALDDTSMLQHLNRGHKARNEHNMHSGNQVP